jgi:hypothetical protein
VPEKWVGDILVIEQVDDEKDGQYKRDANAMCNEMIKHATSSQLFTQ